MNTYDQEKENAVKNCFIICPFGKPGSDERKRADMLLEFIIKPSVEPFGYKVDRADLSAQPGIVTAYVIQHLIEDDLVVADITHHSPNVFYELAIRHAIRKPYIQMISVGQKIPFNIQEIQTVIYDLQNVDDIRKAVETTKKQILFYETGGKVTSPVTVAIDELMGSRSLKEFSKVLSKLSDLERMVTETTSLSDEFSNIKQDILTFLVSFEQSQQSSLKNLISKVESVQQSSRDSGRSKQTPPQTPLQTPVRSSRGKGEYSVSDWIDREVSRWHREAEERKRK